MVSCSGRGNSIETFHLKGSGKKQRKNVKKILVVAGELNPGPMALATSALTTELRQPMACKTFTFYLYTVEQYRLLGAVKLHANSINTKNFTCKKMVACLHKLQFIATNVQCFYNAQSIFFTFNTVMSTSSTLHELQESDELLTVSNMQQRMYVYVTHYIELRHQYTSFKVSYYLQKLFLQFLVIVMTFRLFNEFIVFFSDICSFANRFDLDKSPLIILRMHFPTLRCIYCNICKVVMIIPSIQFLMGTLVMTETLKRAPLPGMTRSRRPSFQAHRSQAREETQMLKKNHPRMPQH